jgi:hypothetical protein
MGPRHCTDAFRPDSWFGGRNWLHRCHTASTTSPYCFLPGASGTVARPYSGSRWHPSDFLSSSVRTSFTLLQGRTTGLFRSPLANSQWHSSMLFLTMRVFIGPVAFVKWGSSQQCPSILGAAQPLLLPDWALCPGCSAVLLSERLDTSQLLLQPQQRISA